LQINAGWSLDVDKRCSAEYMREVFDSHLEDEWSADRKGKKNTVNHTPSAAAVASALHQVSDALK
jgi:hypothetical protein